MNQDSRKTEMTTEIIICCSPTNLHEANEENKPLTGRQSVPGHAHIIHSYTLGEFRFPIKLKLMFVDYGRKLEETHGENMQTLQRKAPSPT